MTRAGAEPVPFGPCPALLAMNRMMTTNDPLVRRSLKDRESILAEHKRRLYFQGQPYRPLHEVLGDGAWAGQPAFIIGGGPSLRGFDFKRLEGRGRTIAINRAFESAPFADVLFFMDNRFYQMVHKGKLGAEATRLWDEFKGLRVFLNILGRQFEDVYSVRSLGRVGLSNSLKAGIYHGNNSGVGAIGLAVCLRANPIYLLGFDCRFSDGQTHFHTGYGFPMSEGVVRSFIRDFERTNRFISKTGFRVVNLNPASGLRIFPFSTIGEVLGNGSLPESEQPTMGAAAAAGI